MIARWPVFGVFGVLGLLLGVGPSAGADPTARKPPLAAVSSVSSVSSVSALLARFAAIPGLACRYEEDKYIALLAAPLRTTGELYFESGGKLARHQTAPTRSSLVVDGGMLVMHQGGVTEQINLRENPAVRMFVDSFLLVLTGDETGLRRLYGVTYAPEVAGGWTLVLRPKVAPLNQTFTRMTVRGQGTTLSSLESIEVGGDRTHMRFLAVDPERRFSAQERQRLFRIRDER